MGLAGFVVHKTMRLLSFLAVIVVFAQAPSAIVFEVELWPGEGRPQFRAIATEIVIRQTPTATSPIVSHLQVTRGQQIAFDETRYRTIQAGTLQALTATSVTGRILETTRLLTRDAYYKGKFPQETIALNSGETFEYLQYRAEGTCFVRIGNRTIDATRCPAEDDRAFLVISEPKTEWWIRVVVDRVPVGWVMVDKKNIEESGRRFD